MSFAWSAFQPQTAPGCNVCRKRWALKLSLRPRLTATGRLHAHQSAVRQSLRHAARIYAGGSDGQIMREASELTYDEQRDKAYREGALFLRSLGIDGQIELTRVLDIAMNPNSLFLEAQQSKLRGNASARLLSVEDDLRPVVAWLSSTGLSPEQINQVIVGHPPILSYSPTEHLQPFFQDLVELGISDPTSIISRRPSLFGISLGDNVQRMVGYLIENGHSIEDVAEMLATTL